jgi:acid stress chaperone HdeB
MPQLRHGTAREPYAFRRRLLTHPWLVVSALSLALFSISDARAQIAIDVSKITCEQLVLYQITNSDNIAIWLHGYYSAKHDTTLVDTQAFKANANKIKVYCRMNSKVTVMQAVETVLGTGR